MPKRPHPPSASRKKTPKAPETADEYLAIAVDLEESGERWRSGDAAKSGRFYLQAITAYETTMARYPNNFDARYNRARLLYTLTQLPLPSNFFPPQSTPESRLYAAVEAHKECNDLEKGSSDVLFNYGQTLSSLGEFYANVTETDGEEEGNIPSERLVRAKLSFEEAYGVFKQCLAGQEGEYKATLEQAQALSNEISSPVVELDDAMGGGDDEEDGGVKLPPIDSSGSFNYSNRSSRRHSTTSSHSSNSANNTQWAAIVEPTTKSTLLDTALAMLEAQTNLLSLATPAKASNLFSTTYLEELTSQAGVVVESYIISIAGTLHLETGQTIEAEQVAEREAEAVLARANFLVALAEVKYYLGLITSQQWGDDIKAAFEAFTLYSDNDDTRVVDPSTSWMALCDRSTAYTALATALLGTDPTQSWKLAGLASVDLAAATKVAPEGGKSEVYLARGNLELFRSRIAIGAAEKAREVLRKNAGVYYRGVVAANGNRLISVTKEERRLAGAVESAKIKEVEEEAKVKEMLIGLEDGDANGLRELMKGGLEKRTLLKIIRASIEDGVFGRDILETVGGVPKS
ncbi:hypothetical protein ABW20_dc0106971 [Dactylellina cionopaga]|nr:hypothetical protein ABW20_dc0106971 [Dactylellina cionopaga]